MNKIINNVPYIKSSREFPSELSQLSVILTRTYVELASSINERTIGLFPVTKSAITGEAWYVDKNQKQQTLRQVYTFTTTANIAHNIEISGATSFMEVSRFTRCFGAFTDGTNWYGLIFGSNVAIAGQISFYITPTNIVFLTGAGAPTLTNGNIVLEWMTNP